MELSNSTRLVTLMNNFSVAYTDYGSNESKFNECMTLIRDSKKLIEELKIELVDMNKNTQMATTAQMERVNVLINLIQIPNLTFDNLKQIIDELQTIHNSIPTTVTVIDNVENELIFDDIDDISDI